VPPATASRQRLFGLITLLLPLAALAALEGALRAARFGSDLPLFVAAEKEPGYRVANPEVAKRFVPGAGAAIPSRIDPVYFLAQKPANGLRIFVQGSSTAAGFPYGRFASLAGMLQQRLGDSLTDREVEVVQTAMAAVNSYAFADFAAEIAAEAPDAVVIYGGHNEYLGFLGVGSTVSAGRSVALTRAYLALRPWRTFQLLGRALRSARGGGARQAASDSEETLMGFVAGERQIPLGSTLYERGLAQLRANLERTLARYARAKIPVFIGTLASNERDQEPLVGGAPAGTAAEDSANAWYERARALDAAGDHAAARSAYLAAKDRDLLRFRAPEAANDVIREVAAMYGATLVDTQRALAQASPHGSIGSELMLEHLHPNLRGYFLLADAFYDALLRSGVLVPRVAPVAREVAWEHQPVCELDRLAGEYRIEELRSHWPFQPVGHAAEPSPPSADPLAALARRMAERETSWTEASRAAFALARERGDLRDAACIADAIAATYPASARSQAQAALWLARSGRLESALRRAARARARAPANADYQKLYSELSVRALTGDAPSRPAGDSQLR
jgi:lysophospholipase L1-like esterase